jgi:hypothetical protein
MAGDRLPSARRPSNISLAGAFALVWLVSSYAMFTRVLLLALAWRERRWVAQPPTLAAS